MPARAGIVAWRGVCALVQIERRVAARQVPEPGSSV